MKISAFFLLLCFSISVYSYGNNAMLLSGKDSIESPNIEAYARVSGIVRYYSPNPYTEKWENSDWLSIDYYNFSAICEGQPLEKILEKYLSVFAPNSYISQAPSPCVRTVQGDRSDYSYWLHHGCGEIKIPGIMRVLKKEFRDYRPFYKELISCSESGLADRNECPQADSVYCYKISDNLYLNIPIAERKDAFSKNKSDLQLKEARKKLNASLNVSGNSLRGRILELVGNKAYRFADMAFRWNIIQHFYPYHLEDDLNWESYLPGMMEAVDTLANGKGTRSDIKKYYDAVLRAMNPVKDGHMLTDPSLGFGGAVSFYLNCGYAPVAFNRDSETGAIFISGKKDTEVLKINGVEASIIFKDCIRKTNTGNDFLATKLALEAMTETDEVGAPLVIELRDGDRFITDTLYGTRELPLSEKPVPDYTMKVIDSILVFNPSGSMECHDRFLPCMDSIADGKYKALVFDLRNYPAFDFEKVLSHLTDTALSTAPMFHIPLSCFPDREYISYSSSHEQIQPALPHIDLPVFFLSGHNTISWGETVLMLAKGYGLGTIIGTPTAGTNGDATSIPMPVFNFRMTAVRATNVDGSRHHGLGVSPDIYLDSENLNDYIDTIKRELN